MIKWIIFLIYIFLIDLNLIEKFILTLPDIMELFLMFIQLSMGFVFWHNVFIKYILLLKYFLWPFNFTVITWCVNIFSFVAKIFYLLLQGRFCYLNKLLLLFFFYEIERSLSLFKGYLKSRPTQNKNCQIFISGYIGTTYLI